MYTSIYIYISIYMLGSSAHSAHALEHCGPSMALVGPPGPLWAPWAFVGPPGRWWAGPLWAPWALVGFP